MVDNPFTRVGNLIAEVPGLKEGADVAAANAEQMAWQAAAGKDIAEHTVIRPDKDRWQVIADTPVWGDAVRQRQNDILSALHRANIEVSALLIKIRPRAASTPASEPIAKPSTRTLDSETADLLVETADNLKSLDLAEAVKRLSLHRGQKSD
ncbi:MAG: hypothetical protein QGH58_02315 [Arenicellales bacterium]|nr:hypothetical protein [Arenicellales bacterium]MDP6790722.1 hypothetical protein [Arenicellales bacterium]MDP6917936.1 hypothetical protein [Arenicellales bacterium]